MTPHRSPSFLRALWKPWNQERELAHSYTPLWQSPKTIFLLKKEKGNTGGGHRKNSPIGLASVLWLWVVGELSAWSQDWAIPWDSPSASQRHWMLARAGSPPRLDCVARGLSWQRRLQAASVWEESPVSYAGRGSTWVPSSWNLTVYGDFPSLLPHHTPEGLYNQLSGAYSLKDVSPNFPHSAYFSQVTYLV